MAFAVYGPGGHIFGVLRQTMREAEQDAQRAATSRTLEVWWLNDCGVRKVLLATCSRGEVARNADGEAVAAEESGR